jgi:hypothetical protein
MRERISLLLTVCLTASVSEALPAGNTPSQRRTGPPEPLVRAHAHNDYEHKRPLLDALDHGFCGVEADIHLVDGKLLVAHDRDKVSPERTLEALYLDPLRERAKANGGRVHPNGPDVMLLIDIKSGAEPTYAVLRVVLKGYAEILTEFSVNQTRTNAVTVVVSGNRPRETMAKEAHRYAAYDGRLADLGSTATPGFIPLISDNWASHFQWRGTGPLADAEREKLRHLVRTAHREGRRFRFWGAPDTPEVWKEFYEAGVDLINTDNLAGLREFLLNQSKK